MKEPKPIYWTWKQYLPYTLIVIIAFLCGLYGFYSWAHRDDTMISQPKIPMPTKPGVIASQPIVKPPLSHKVYKKEKIPAPSELIYDAHYPKTGGIIYTHE